MHSTFNIWVAMGLHHSTMAQMLLTHLMIIPASDGDRYLPEQLVSLENPKIV
jgi:hypothetical protein